MNEIKVLTNKLVSIGRIDLLADELIQYFTVIGGAADPLAISLQNLARESIEMLNKERVARSQKQPTTGFYGTFFKDFPEGTITRRNNPYIFSSVVVHYEEGNKSDGEKALRT